MCHLIEQNSYGGKNDQLFLLLTSLNLVQKRKICTKSKKIPIHNVCAKYFTCL